MKQKNHIRCICEAGIAVALAVILSFLKVKFLAEGGSVDLVMIPLVVFALRRGGVWGIAAGAVFGLIKCFIGEGAVYGWQAILLDYILAYAAVGIAGFLRKKPVIAAAAATAGRLLIHVISGIVLWGEYMPDVFLGMKMNIVWLYSLLYNSTFMIPCGIILMAVIAAMDKKTKVLVPEN